MNRDVLLADPRAGASARRTDTAAGRRVVVLSRGGKFLARVMDELGRRGVCPTAVVLYRDHAAPPGTGPRRGLRARLGPVFRPARVWLRQRREARALRGRVPVFASGPLQGGGPRKALRGLAPDVVVLAGCGMLAAEYLEIPREATVNVHPGLLPWIRGNNPVANSLLRGVPPGCSAFRVDPGIDTGPLLERRLVPVRGGESMAELQEATVALWASMTAELVEAALDASLPPGSPQAERFPLCRTVTDPDLLLQVDEAVRDGVATALFDRWAPRCDPARLSLPLGVR